MIPSGVPLPYDNEEFTLPSGKVVKYHSEGRGPAIVLLHGLNAHSGTWRKNVKYFAEDYFVIAPSLPPFRGPPETLPIAGYVDLVEALLAKMEVESAFFIGNSLGGWISMNLALRRKGIAKSLILEDSAGGPLNESNDLPEKITAERIPSLVIWGRDDKIILPEVGRRLAVRLGDSKFQLVEGAAHSPHWEKPDEFNALVRDFISRKS